MIQMNIEVAPQERMAETGSSLIRLIQNNDMPFLDLLVREAVQNSLDASKEGEGYTQVDFSIREFCSQDLIIYFEGIDKRISELYPEKSYRLLEIRDSNTFGLTGPLFDKEQSSDQYGNLIKLVYQIGMPQQREGSGGSWGLGKTVYFRIGIGLVLYYSRIYEDGKYHSRLAACLVEDEQKNESLLKNKGKHRGIAWWGQVKDGQQSTMPVTDENLIHSILKSCGTLPYTNEETGTTIIIPFMRDDLRPSFHIGNDEVEGEERHFIQEEKPWWYKNDSDYLKIALQRWYAPRLMNSNYQGGRWLRATVNGEGIEKKEFLSVFGLIQDLYNFSIESSSKELKKDAGIFSLPINLRTIFQDGTVAGWISFKKVTAEELGMVPPHNSFSPWVQVFGRNIGLETNPALISYTRKPGMVVGYEYTGKWVEGIPKTTENEYTIGIFVANSNNTMNEVNPKHSSKNFLFEEYIRGCEKADHTSWTDWVPQKKNLLIVEKIQKQLVKHINTIYSGKKEQKEIRKDMILGELLADALLPPEGFGGFASIQKPVKISNNLPLLNGATGRFARFTKIDAPIYEQDRIRIDYELFTGEIGSVVEIKLGILTESRELNSESWESEDGIGTMFPIKFVKFSVLDEQLLGADSESIDLISIDVLQSEKKINGIGLGFIYSEKFHQAYGVKIDGIKRKIIKGSFWIHSKDKALRASFSVKAATEETKS